MPDGSTITRISTEQFIALSYEDKMKYLSTFTEEQQTVIINNFTPEEYKSMLRQLPTGDKLNVIGNLSSISESFGVNLIGLIAAPISTPEHTAVIRKGVTI